MTGAETDTVRVPGVAGPRGKGPIVVAGGGNPKGGDVPVLGDKKGKIVGRGFLRLAVGGGKASAVDNDGEFVVATAAASMVLLVTNRARTAVEHEGYVLVRPLFVGGIQIGYIVEFEG